MGFVLFSLFMAVMGSFRSLRNEFDSFFFFTETMLFATTPLVAATILTWFLCLEAPVLDLPSTFSVCYFIYMITLSKPRPCSFPVSAQVTKDPNNRHKCLVLPLHILQVMYAVPVFVSPILHVASKFNVLSGTLSSLVSLAISVLFPSLLMLFCVEQQIEHWPRSSSDEVLTAVGTAKIVNAALLFACLQDHPLLDDIKSFSGLSDTLSSAAICAAAVLLALAVYIRRSNQDYSNFTSTAERGLKAVLVSLCLGGAAVIGGILVDLPVHILPLVVGGTVSIAEFYQRGWAGNSFTMQITGLLLIIMGAATAALVAMCFSRETLFYLTISFSWHATEFSVQAFCGLFAASAALAVVVPALAYGSKSVPEEGEDDLVLPGAGARSAASSCGLWGAFSSALFALALPLCALLTSAVEIMVREQVRYSDDTPSPPSATRAYQQSTVPSLM